MNGTGRSTGAQVVTGLCVLAILGMLGLFVVSSLEMGLGAGLALVADSWWGITTLADLGAGVAVIAVWICVLERRPAVCAAWIIGLMCLGNFTTLVYLLVRSLRQPTIHDVFLAPRPGPSAE